MTAGQRIKAARKKAGLTQSELANKLNIPYQSIGQWENDLRNPKKETLQKIAAALGVPASQLLGHDEEIPLESKAVAEIAALIRNGYVTIDKDGKPQWNINGPIDGKSLDEQERFADLSITFSKLNEAGQQKAVERVEELTEIPKYQKK